MRVLGLLLLIVACERPLGIPAGTGTRDAGHAPDCRRLTTSLASLPGTGQAMTAVYTDRGLWRGFKRGTGVWVTIDPLGIVSTSSSALPADVEPFGALMDGDRLVLSGKRRGSEEGVVLALDPDTGAILQITGGLSAVYTLIRRKDGAIFAVAHGNHGGGLFRLLDQQGAFGMVPLPDETSGEMGRNAPAAAIDGDGWVYLLSPNRTDGARITLVSPEDDVSTYPIEGLRSDRLSALVRTTRGDVVAGTLEGKLVWFRRGIVQRTERTSFADYARTGMSWCAGQVDDLRTIQSLAQLETGLIFANCVNVGQWFDGLASCPPQPASNEPDTNDNRSAIRMLPLGDERFLISGLGSPIFVVQSP